MATRKWYQDPKFSVPVTVALIGLVATIVTVSGGRQEAAEKKQSNPPSGTTAPATSSPGASTAPPPPPVPVVSFPVVVIDDSTGDHIPRTRIVADEQGISTETDSQGRSSLSVRPGQAKLRVTVSHPDYRTQNVELTVFEGMDPARIRLQRR